MHPLEKDRDAPGSDMVSRLSRVVQAARDIVLLVFSAVLIGSSYGRWVQELVFLVLFIFGASIPRGGVYFDLVSVIPSTSSRNPISSLVL